MTLVVRDGVLGNLDSFALGERALERVRLPSDDLAKRLLRLTTSAGEIGLRFAGSERLRDGDIVYADERIVVAVRVEPDDVLVFRPDTIAAAVRIAHALGNRHLPIHADGNAIVVRFDPLLEALGTECGVAATRERRTVARPFRHAHAPHRHE